MVDPNLADIEQAVDRFTFPISKRDMMDGIDDSETLLMDGRNVDLRTLVRDLNDDFFDSEDEFRVALRDHLMSEWAMLPPRDDSIDARFEVDARGPAGTVGDIGDVDAREARDARDSQLLGDLRRDLRRE